MDTASLIDSTAAPIHELGGAFYYAPATAKRGESLGLDVFMFYGLGRGGVLGDVDADDVVKAFRWFSPTVVRAQWNEGRELADPATVALAYVEAARAYARSTFTETEVLRAFCLAASEAVAAAPSGRWPLVDGYRAFELPEDCVARAYQLVVILREMRGAAHGDAVEELGLSPAEAHFLTGGDTFELYAYDGGDVPVTDELIERRALAEDRTTALLVPCYDVLDEDRRIALLEGVRELAATADIAVEDVAD
jgi:hypothetical protein